MIPRSLLQSAVLAAVLFAQVVATQHPSASLYASSGPADIYLGGLFPVHANEDNRCGRILDLGIQRLEAMVFAVDQINADPSLLPGLKLGFAIRDTCTQENQALEEALTYVATSALQRSTQNETGISGVVGAASSSVSVAVANLLRLFHIPQISYASTAKFLSDKTRFDYFFRTIPPDLFQARAMVDLIVRFNWTYVIAINSADTYGREGIRALVDELEDVSLNSTDRCIAAQIELPRVATEQQYDETVNAMEQTWVRNASVVVIFGQLATAEGVLRAVARRKAVDPVFARRSLTFIGSDAWGDQLPAVYHQAAHGMLSVIPSYRESQEFNRYFQSQTPQSSANPWFGEYWESVFNCSLEGEGGETQCDVAAQAISAASGYRQNSKVPFAIDAVYAFAHSLHNLLQDVCGRVVLCPQALANPGSPVVKGALLLQYLHNVSFPGVSEFIQFDQNGDQHGGYRIKNLQYKNASGEGNGFRYVNVGSWDRETEQLNITEDVQWNSEGAPDSICSRPCPGGQFPASIEGEVSCCWVCTTCPREREVSDGLKCVTCQEGFSPDSNKTNCLENPLSFLSWSHPFTIVILLLNMLGLAATTIVIVTFLACHKHTLVKASSRELSAVLLAGIFLCYLLPFFSVGMPNAFTCAVRRFGFGVSFSLCYSALLVKTNRIHRIFNRPMNTVQQPPLISPQSQLFFTALLVLVQAVISAVWLVVERPGIAHVYDNRFTEVTCAATPYISLPVSLGYNFLLLIASTYYAFRTRKIPQNFNETKFINLTLYSVIIIWLAFIPAYFATARLGSLFRTGSQVFAIVMSATTTLVCLFFPKLYFISSAYRKEGL